MELSIDLTHAVWAACTVLVARMISHLVECCVSAAAAGVVLPCCVDLHGS